jgi:probable HAF family extracellular repeat protein
MKSRTLTCTTAIALLAVLVPPLGLAAQDSLEHKDNHKHHHYKLIDVGTFGGPQSWVFGAFEQQATTLNNAGTVVGGADTSNSNPNYPNVNPVLGPALLFGYADPFVFQAFKWNEGALINLGTLPGGYNSFPSSISANGLVAGTSENGVIDPVGGFPEVHAVLWKDGQIMDLGTLDGKTESVALAVNNRGQVVGGASDASFNARAFLWTEDQGLQDLGTLGASGALATQINDPGQITGVSGLCDTCNQDAFFWEKGNMQRIPDFGGPISGPAALNNRGQVVGQSDLPGGAKSHAFLWEKGVLTDLGTLPGGTGSGARWINEAGDTVGVSQNGQIYHAVLWKRRKVVDLGAVDQCSIAESINSEGQIIGESDNCDGVPLHAFLWENGGPIVDLNTLIPPGSGLTLTLAVSINDRGEIAGQATTSNGDNHAFLLVPCDEKHGDGEGCEDGRGTDATQSIPAQVSQNLTTTTTQPSLPSERMNAIRARLAHRYPYRGFGSYQSK